MKQFLRLLLAAGVIAFAVSMTAVSCGKPDAGGGNNNNNNNNANNSGGDGNGGGGGDTPQGPPAPAITIGNFDAAAKLGTQVGGNDRVLINASQFPTTRLMGTTGNAQGAVSLGAGLTKRIFDMTITGGATGAVTAGMVMVDNGTRTKFADFSTPAQTGATLAGSDNLYILLNAGGFFIYAIFIDDTAPTSNDPNAAPFAFSYAGGAGSQPLLICRSNIKTITSATPAATTVLTGGQTASCHVGSRGGAFSGGTVTNWFTALAGNTNLKKRFYFTVAGMRTDSKPLSEVVKSLTGANDAAKVTAFLNGLTTTEMALLDNDNITAFKKIMVEVVTDAVFTAP